MKVKVGDNSKIVGDRIEKLKTLVGKFRSEIVNTDRKITEVFNPFKFPTQMGSFQLQKRLSNMEFPNP